MSKGKEIFLCDRGTKSRQTKLRWIDVFRECVSRSSWQVSLLVPGLQNLTKIQTNFVVLNLSNDVVWNRSTPRNSNGYCAPLVGVAKPGVVRTTKSLLFRERGFGGLAPHYVGTRISSSSMNHSPCGEHRKPIGHTQRAVLSGL